MTRTRKATRNLRAADRQSRLSDATMPFGRRSPTPHGIQVLSRSSHMAICFGA
jgi:hypothetical protein